MKKYRVGLFSILISAVLLLIMSFPVYADELQVGSVKGLPEKLVVLDDNGQSVSENGEYFFRVDDMVAGETYTKKIQIMNLREDATYRITFRAQPIESTGDFDLDAECDCNIYLDNKLVYYGRVSGDGMPDIRERAISLGMYKPGESHVMRVDVRWRGTDTGKFFDNGAKIVSTSGTSVVREPSGESHIHGETLFKWIFYAEVRGNDEPIEVVSEVTKPGDNNTDGGTSDTDTSTPSHDFSGSNGNSNMSDVINTGDTIVIIAIIVVALAMLMLVVLVFGKNKKKKKNKT